MPRNASGNMPGNTTDIVPDRKVLEQAADWMVLLQSGEATARDRSRIEHWRSQSPHHEAAWQRAGQIMGLLGAVPGELAGETLGRLDRKGRRRIALKLALLMATGPLAWAGWQGRDGIRAQLADVQTGTGEQLTHTLADGGTVLLNTGSAVNVVYTDEIRALELLRGEILVTTASDHGTATRPFVVRTAYGEIRALGTCFDVALTGRGCRVAVYEGAVRVSNVAGEAAGLRIEAGWRGQADGNPAVWSREPMASGNDRPAWTRGMLLAQDMPLETLLGELARYRPGVIRCDPALAQLRVSGAFPVLDSDRSLNLLAQTLPVRIVRMTRYWIRVVPAAQI